MRLDMKQLRVDHEKAIVAISSRVEQIVAGNQRQLDEAQELIRSRESLVSKWKEEALLVHQSKQIRFTSSCLHYERIDNQR